MNLVNFPIFSGAAALFAVLVLIWLASRAARFTGLAVRGNSARRLGITETLPLDQRRRLHLVRCDGRELLILTGGGSDAVIGWVTPAENP